MNVTVRNRPVEPFASPPPPRQRRRAAAASAFASALLLVACGDDGDTAAPAAGDDTETTTADVDIPTDTTTSEDGDAEGEGTDGEDEGSDGGDGAAEPCNFVSDEAVQGAFGDEVEFVRGGDNCGFRIGEVFVTITYIQIQIDPAQYADEAIAATCDEGTVVEVESGDRAYACQSFVGPFASVFRGTDSVAINTSSVEDEDAESVVEQLAALLPEVDPSA